MEREFDELYTASFRQITHQLHAMIGDRDEAQECVQEAFAKAWAHRRRLAAVEHREAWVLHHLADLPVQAVAAEIGVARGHHQGAAQPRPSISEVLRQGGAQSDAVARPAGSGAVLR